MRPARPSYWRKTQVATWLLLLLWFVVSFLPPYFARDMQWRFFGWPLSFWMTAQGVLIVYLVIIAFYAWYMNRLDESFQVEDGPKPDERP